MAYIIYRHSSICKIYEKLQLIPSCN